MIVEAGAEKPAQSKTIGQKPKRHKSYVPNGRVMRTGRSNQQGSIPIPTPTPMGTPKAINAMSPNAPARVGKWP